MLTDKLSDLVELFIPKFLFAGIFLSVVAKLTNEFRVPFSPCKLIETIDWLVSSLQAITFNFFIRRGLRVAHNLSNT